MEVLCTGSKGFIGTNLVECLEKKGHRVIDYDIRDNVCYDTRYFQRLKMFVKNHAEQVYHLAAIPAHRLSMDTPWEIVHNNYISTLNVAESCRLGDCNKIIFLSSFAIYGSQPTPWTEDTPVQATTPYGLCKIQCEELLRRYHEWYGIDVIIIRPTNVFGEYEELHKPLQVIPKWFDDLRCDRLLIVYGSETTRDFTYVGDLVDGIISASKKTGFEIYNLCGGDPILLKDIAEKISNKVETFSLPDYETEKWYGSYEKAEKELDWKPTKTIWEWIDERKREIESEKDHA